MSKVSATAPKVVTPKPEAKDKPAVDAPATHTHAAADAKAGADAVGDTPGTSAPAGAHTHPAAPAGGGTDATDPATTHAKHGTNIQPPARNDPRFAAGSTGPTVKEGDAPTLKIPDGVGFGGLKGRQQNDNDKKQNNYSVTDANFNNRLGVLATDPDTGKPMTYVQDIQTYNAAGYLETYAPKVYGQLSAAQDAGRGTILGGAAHLMGLTKTADPSEAGIDPADIPTTVPGTTLNAREEVMNPKDATGQDWARPHHAETHWAALKNLTDLGVDQAHAVKFSGDDAVSGAGRLNGVNNQDGTSGFNAGELEIYKEAAAYQQQTGKNVIFAMMDSHNHLGGDPSALTDPAINKQLGLASNDRSVTVGRANAIAAGLNNGTVKNEHNHNNNNANNDNGGGGGNDVDNDPVIGDDAPLTEAGTGALGTVDTVDPIASLTEIATAGFADGAAGTGFTRLSLILQSLLKGLADGTEVLTPELLAALTAIATALAASTDPALQALGKALTELTTKITTTGTIDQDAFLALEKIVGQTGALAKNLDPVLAQQMGVDPVTGVAPAAGVTDANGGAAALGTTPGGTLALAATSQAVAGAGASVLVGQPATPGATTSTTASTTAMPGMVMPAATPAPVTAPAVTTAAPVTATAAS